jgi:hypothetical protein
MSATSSSYFIQCVEYSKIDESAHMFDVVHAKANEIVVFPYVNSCLAMIYLISDESVVCAHISAQITDKLLYKEMLLEYDERIKNLVDPSNIGRRIFIGDAAWEKYVSAQVHSETKKKLNSNDTYFSTSDGALDVFVKLGAKKITVCKSAGTTPGNSPPSEGTPIHSLSF